MAEASISVDLKQFSCPVCLDLLTDPVTIPCGHSYCMVCITRHWDEDDQRGVYSCPQCRLTFTPRPVLCRNSMLAEVVENVKRMVCVASVCETHLKPHLEIPALIKHKLVTASPTLQEKICSQHDEVLKIYCRTDQSCDDTVEAVAERTEKQSELQELQRKSQQRLQEKEKELQELKQAVDTLKNSAQTAVEDSERIFTELICSIEKKRSEVIKLIRDQEKNQLIQIEELLEKLQQEIDDLKRRNTELEQLSLTENHIQFLQSFQSLSVSSGCEDSTSITVQQHLSFDGVKKSICDLKERLEEFCKEEFSKIFPHGAAAAVQMILSSEPKTREDFLQYFSQLTLDPNTINHSLSMSEENRVLRNRGGEQFYSDHPERFDSRTQVLCNASLSGRCYWEVEWNRVVQELFSALSWVSISVSYKGISRKGWGNECVFGCNDQSWSLVCSSTLTFWHNNIRTELTGPSSSRIGVYVDHSAGTLSFYSVSDTMTLLHTVHTTFTQPLYAGFEVVGLGSSVKLCDSVMK